VVAEPAGDLDLSGRLLLALLCDRSGHARQDGDLGEEVDDDVGEPFVLVLPVDDLLPVPPEDRLGRVREDAGVLTDLVRLGGERRVDPGQPSWVMTPFIRFLP